MSKGAKQTTTSAPAAPTTALQGQVYNSATNAANHLVIPGADPATTGALSTYQGYGAAGQNGLAALGGNQDAMATLMNPYINSVINPMAAQFGNISQQLTNQNNSDATAQRAFGGSRAAVTNGAAQGQLGLGEATQMGQLLSQGYSGAQGVASQLANLGLSGAAGSDAIGQYLQQLHYQQMNPGITQTNILQGAAAGTPYGTTTTTPVNRNTGAGILGGAATRAGIGSMIPGIGTGVGAVAGGILGLF
jgi:hypothetical protein